MSNQTPSGPAAAPSKAKVFARRLLTTLVLWALILGALFSGTPWIAYPVFLLIMVFLTVVGLAEFYEMVRRRGLVCFSRWGIAGAVLLVAGTFVFMACGAGVGGQGFESGMLILFVIGLGLLQLCAKGNPHGYQAIGMTLFGLMYVPYLLNFIQKIYFFPEVNGALYLFYFVLITKISDTGAYSVGSLIGRHKMIPRISPGKTWEGLAGALAVPMGVSLLFAYMAGESLAGMTLGHAAVLGLILGAGAVVGDLIESLLKREAAVKDSGKFFPGIGGVLDLVDSLLFNAPLMYLYLRYLLPPIQPG